MRYINAGLQTSISSGVYDKTKTSLFGRSQQKTINSVNVVGPPSTVFVDTQTDATIVPGLAPQVTPNGRMFIPVGISGGILTIALYNFNLTTGAKSYVGKITANFPNSAATTHTFKFFRVYDGASVGVITGWKIVVGTTGSVAINGGVFLINNVALSDFVPISPPVFGLAITNNAKSVYQLQDPAALGVSNNITALMGGGLNRSTQEILLTNGTAASMTMHGFDLTLTPNIINLHSTAQSQTTLFVGTSPSAFFSTNAATTTMQANDPIVITANAPTGFTASTSVSQTVYFARDIQTVTGVVYFNLSATSGGVAITPGSNTTNINIMRAFGQSSSLYEASRKTGTVATGFIGTALGTDSQCIDTINDVLSPNNGQVCYFVSTNSNFYHFRLTDISSGATNLPTAFGVNALGAGIDIITPTPTFATYDSTTGKIIFTNAAFSFMAKNWANGSISSIFGGQSNQWLENNGQVTQYFRCNAINSISRQGGWLFVSTSTAGQRGVLCIDMQSDNVYGYSYGISPIIDTQAISSKMGFITTLEQLFNLTDGTELYYRTAATSSDAIFNSATGSWSLISENADLSSISIQRYIQFKMGHDVLSLLSGTPSQVSDIVLGYQPITDSSMNWEGSVDNSSQSGSSPMYVAFRLLTSYTSGTVPTLYVRGIDDSGNIAYSYNTSTNASDFKYSTNNGTSWNALGTIPNTPLTTEVRLQVTSPSGTRLTWSINES